ncbi:SnoaL-like domain-containing protein [Pseudoalteromonas sp. JBTF-M23]|uniref:SnoaL-like domain-containing protein n=1 Tax=Pseudoalteromonas caenipelagi TaxID=2726988 RepID=A0A849VDI1_9GAMM|nr:ester cyclase [Pseudoalteromonas caenipelagi]NOU49751.1 SnoaL-like domain-containing protein [Pseudoalteromonas caenipelagi]
MIKSNVNLRQIGAFFLILLINFNVLAGHEKSTGDITASNLVVSFYERVFINKEGNIRAVSEQFLHKDYIQHNPYVATGREAFIETVGDWLKNESVSIKREIKRVITQDDMVVLHVHAYDTRKSTPGSAGVDIFRVHNGKIIEHWDVWQKIPSNMSHDNGML